MVSPDDPSRTDDEATAVDAFNALLRSNSGRLTPRVRATKTLGGGLSGAKVSLVWPEGTKPVVIKVGPEEEIRLEDEGRKARVVNLGWLPGYGLAGVAQLSNGAAAQAALAYPYFGPIRYDELDDFADLEAVLTHKINTGEFTYGQLRAAFDYVLNNLTSPRRTDDSAALPLASYLPELNWQVIERGLAIIDQMTPQDTILSSLKSWWTGHVYSAPIVPLHDDRVKHGDPRLANILVNTVTAQTEMIDFGLSKRGHFFTDLARFEVDLALRCVPHDLPPLLRRAHRQQNLSSMIERHSNADATVQLWLERVQRVVPELADGAVRTMYQNFLLVECLKRTGWVRPGSEANVGGRMSDLIFAIQSILKRLGYESSNYDATSVREALELLGADQLYVPIKGAEWTANAARNKAKKQALQRAAASGSTVYLLADTGHSFLHSRRPFFEDVVHLLESGGRLEAVIHATSAAGRGDGDRARKLQESLDGLSFLAERYSSRIQVFSSSVPVAQTTLIAGETAFFEPYFKVAPDKRAIFLFNTFELRFSQRSHVYDLLLEQFHRLASESPPLAAPEWKERER